VLLLSHPWSRVMLLLHQLFKVVPELLADTLMQREYLLLQMTFCWFAYITIGCASLLLFLFYVESHCKQDVVGLQAAHWTLLPQTAEAQQNSIHRPLLQQQAAAGASQSGMWSGVIGLSRGERTMSSFKSRCVPWTCLRQQQAGRDLG